MEDCSNDVRRSTGSGGEGVEGHLRHGAGDAGGASDEGDARASGRDATAVSGSGDVCGADGAVVIHFCPFCILAIEAQ